MVDSLKASQTGLRLVEQARQSKRWNRTAQIWCDRAFTSRATLSRFWAGQAVRREIFIAICEAIGVCWQEVTEHPGSNLPLMDSTGSQQIEELIRISRNSGNAAASHPANSSSASFRRYDDWGDAPEASACDGRSLEIAQMAQWILQEQCRLVLLTGLAGIGKTSLAAKFARLHDDQFEIVIWRSLSTAPRVQDLIVDLLQVFSDKPVLPNSVRLDSQLLELLNYLRSHRCLIVLDGLEAMMSDVPEVTAPHLPSFCPDSTYARFFRSIGKTDHKSCLLLTSREKPKEMMALETSHPRARNLLVRGLCCEEAKAMLQSHFPWIDNKSDWDRFIERYSGNPLALKTAASMMQTAFDGNLHAFLSFLHKSTFIFQDIQDAFNQQFCRLSAIEQRVICSLATSHQPLSLTDLKTELTYSTTAIDLLQAIAALHHRCLIEKLHDRFGEPCFTPTSIVRDYIIHQIEASGSLKTPTPQGLTSIIAQLPLRQRQAV